jgi:putrescine transport system ATP-binding protein
VNLLRCMRTTTGRLDCPELGCELAVAADAAGRTADDCWVAIRPEQIQLSAQPPADAPADNRVSGTLEAVVYLGAQSVFHVRVAGGALVQVVVPMAAPASATALERGQAVWLAWASKSQVVLPG